VEKILVVRRSGKKGAESETHKISHIRPNASFLHSSFLKHLEIPEGFSFFTNDARFEVFLAREITGACTSEPAHHTKHSAGIPDLVRRRFFVPEEPYDRHDRREKTIPKGCVVLFFFHNSLAVVSSMDNKRHRFGITVAYFPNDSS
jgi:hypothetical protein